MPRGPGDLRRRAGLGALLPDRVRGAPLGHALGRWRARTASSPAATRRSTRSGSRRGIASGVPTSRPRTRRSRRGSGSRCKLDKGDFVGRDALVARRRARAAGCAASTLADARAVALGSEPVRVGDASRRPGHERRLRLHGRRSIAYAYLPAEPTSAPRSRWRSSATGSRARWPRSRCSTRRVSGSARDRVRPARGGGRRASGRTASHEWEVLGGGITNHNVKVTRAGRRVRAADRRPGHGPARDRPLRRARGLSRPRLRSASGPEVVDVRRARGLARHALHRGHDPAGRADARARDVSRVSRAALRAVHAGPPIAGRFDAFEVVEEYRTTAFDRGREVPPAYAWARQVARRDRAAPRVPRPSGPVTTTCSTRTSSTTATAIRIVDWEYAGMGDVVLRSRQLLHQPRARRRRAPGAARGLLRRGATPSTSGARADAVHVRLPRGDVGRGAERRLGARLRLRRPTRRSTSSGWSGPPAEPAFRAPRSALKQQGRRPAPLAGAPT